MTSFFLGLASFLLVLIPLVIIHEFGHFIAAKLSGITVLEFGIGFPPRITTLFTRGDTIYTLNWLPIGGFVRPYGEDFVRQKGEDEMTADDEEIKERGIENPKSVFQANPWQRIFFMAAGPGINFITALVLLIVVALVGEPYGKAKVTIYDIMPNSPAAQAGLQQGDVIVQLNGQDVNSADQFNELVSSDANQSVDLLVQRGSDTMNVSLTAQPVAEANTERVYITNVEQDMPAYEAGFKVDDVIVAVDGQEIKSITQLQQYTEDHKGQTIDVTVLRGSQTLVLPVTPKEDSQGRVRMGIGIAGAQPAIIGLTAVNRDAKTYTKAQPLGEAIKTGTQNFIDTNVMLYDMVRDLINGKIALSAARPVSPIGIGQIGGPVLDQSIEQGVAYPIVTFAALISIALAVTNLLPIPALDGGRILFVVIELIRGKPMEPEREGAIHFIGLLLLLGLIALTVINDIINPINIGNLK